MNAELNNLELINACRDNPEDDTLRKEYERRCKAYLTENQQNSPILGDINHVIRAFDKLVKQPGCQWYDENDLNSPWMSARIETHPSFNSEPYRVGVEANYGFHRAIIDEFGLWPVESVEPPTFVPAPVEIDKDCRSIAGASELLVVVYNGRQNAYEGPRNIFTKVKVADKAAIKQTIQEQFNGPLAKRVGHVLVKFDGKMWLCERDTVNPAKIYTRHEITYHPMAKHFTI